MGIARLRACQDLSRRSLLPLVRRKSTAVAPHIERSDAATRIERAAILERAVQLTWEDGTTSNFHHNWLRDHCPQSVHPVSHQREVPLAAVRHDDSDRTRTLKNTIGTYTPRRMSTSFATVV